MRAGQAGWSQMLARARFVLNETGNEMLKREWNAPLQPIDRCFERFSMPKGSWDKWSDRVTLNSHIYQTNYLVILGLFLGYYVLTHLWSVVLLMIIAAGWYVVLSPAGAAFRAGPHFLAAPLTTFVLLSLSGTFVSLSQYLFLASSFILAHATFRHTSARTKLSEIRERMSNQW